MKNKIWLGSLCILLSCILFSLTSLTVKIASAHYSGWAISLIRFTIGAGFSFAAVLLFEKNFKIKNFKNWFFRGFFGSLSMLTFYLGIQLNSSGRAALLGDTYPVFVAISGFLFFKEKIMMRNIVAIFFCIAGAVMVFYDNSHYSLLGDLLCVFSAITGGLAIQNLKKAREGNSSFMIYLAPCLFGAILSSFSVPEISKTVQLTDLIPIILVGILAFSGQIVMTFAYKYIQATSGSILGMAEIPITLVVSFMFIHERMQPRFLTGAAVIIAGLLLNQIDWKSLNLKKSIQIRQNDLEKISLSPSKPDLTE